MSSQKLPSDDVLYPLSQSQASPSVLIAELAAEHEQTSESKLAPGPEQSTQCVLFEWRKDPCEQSILQMSSLLSRVKLVAQSQEKLPSLLTQLSLTSLQSSSPVEHSSTSSHESPLSSYPVSQVHIFPSPFNVEFEAEQVQVLLFSMSGIYTLFKDRKQELMIFASGHIYRETGTTSKEVKDNQNTVA